MSHTPKINKPKRRKKVCGISVCWLEKNSNCLTDYLKWDIQSRSRGELDRKGIFDKGSVKAVLYS